MKNRFDPQMTFAADDGAGGAAGGAEGAAAGGAAAAAAADWRAGLEPDLKASPALASFKSVADLAKEHVNLQGLIGRKGAIVPTDKDGPEIWDRFHAAIGRPDKPEGYGFKKPENFQGPWDDALGAEWAKDLHAIGVPKAMADKLFGRMLERASSTAQAEAQRHASELKAADTALRAELGTAYDGKVELARRAARQFAGVEQLDQLEKIVGTPSVLKLMIRIGESLGEDGLVGERGGAGGGGTMTPKEAKSALDKLNGEASSNPKHPLMDKLHPEHDAMVERQRQLVVMANAKA